MKNEGFLWIHLGLESAWLANEDTGRVIIGILKAMKRSGCGSGEKFCGRGLCREGGNVEEMKGS